MAGTMTWVGLDVHARSTHGAAIDSMTGELTRLRFGPGVEAPIAWLTELPGPVRACYEAGPTGFWLYRAATAAGVAMQVIAPGKTPKDLLDFWNRELVKVLNDPKVKVELAKVGLDPAPGTREELAQYMDRENQTWGKVVREAKITAE